MSLRHKEAVQYQGHGGQHHEQAQRMPTWLQKLVNIDTVPVGTGSDIKLNRTDTTLWKGSADDHEKALAERETCLDLSQMAKKAGEKRRRFARGSGLLLCDSELCWRVPTVPHCALRFRGRISPTSSPTAPWRRCGR